MSSEKRGKQKRQKSIFKHSKKGSVRFTFNPVKLGIALIGLSLVLAVTFFHSFIFQEIGWFFSKPNKNLQPIVSQIPVPVVTKKTVVAADPQFSVVIPKIGANSRVVKDVDPLNPDEYQVSLTKGVAHAKGTALPGKKGNVFLFAHSSDNFYNANRYNAVFYLLNKLEPDDKVYLVFEEKIYEYKVSEVKIVDEREVQYMAGGSDGEVVTLMTCWPAGTTLKRLVAVAERV